jgi:hypothetical protein
MPGNAGIFAVFGLDADAAEIIAATVKMPARKENCFI